MYYVCAAVAVIISGLAKGGFAGIGALAMPVMAMGVDPVAGATILLPVLIVQDVTSVRSPTLVHHRFKCGCYRVACRAIRWLGPPRSASP
jgi:hypothetical protein